jgi:peptidoglycan/LPS O-acetylase OafA/YrhL
MSDHGPERVAQLTIPADVSGLNLSKCWFRGCSDTVLQVSSAAAELIVLDAKGPIAPAVPPADGPAPGAGRRPALDGVRALAVTAVAVYHFGGGAQSWLPGGFLGVDVFFVLSGYLITGLLIGEYAQRGRIDLLGFWLRRLRRLAPALLLVLLAVTAWIWWATPPDAYPNRRSDVFWTVGYLANWHLIATSDTYFAAYTTASPLRHAWSLAVEEQFYLVWPAIVFALLWAGRRWLGRLPALRPLRRLGSLGSLSRARLLCAVATVLGIVLSAVWMAGAYSPLQPSRAYYSTQGRVQELFVGCLLAVILPRLRRSAGRWVAVVAGAGVVTLVVAFGLMSDQASFYYHGGALGVCLMVAAVISGVEIQPGGALARIFSWRPAVGLGRISYGVYLWHWPLVVAIDVNEGMPVREQVVRQSLRVGLTLAAAIGSYFMIERPVMRSRRVLASPRRVIGAAVASSVLVIAVAIPATALPGTLSDQLRHNGDTACPGERTDRLVACTWPLGANTGQRPVRLALLGDSTARVLGPGLHDWAAGTQSSWLEAAWIRCSSTGLLALSGTVVDVPAQTCTDQAPGLIRQALATYRPPVVLVAEFWASTRPLLVDGKRLPAGSPEHDAALKAGYLSIVDQVAAYGGRTVFLELPPPGEQLGSVVAPRRPAGEAKPPVIGGGRFVDGFNAILRSVAAARPESSSTVSVTDLICPQGHCGPVQNGMLVRTDGVHYSIPFSRYLVPELLRRSGVSATP